MDFSEVLLDNWDIKLLIFARILGLFSFNPILSRSNVPVRVRVGVTLLITYIVCLTLKFDPAAIDTGPTAGTYAFCFIRETFIGLVLGFVCDLFVYSLYIAGDVMDSQAGLGMAKVFDPDSKIQMSIYGSFAGFMMYLYFFVVNGHMTFIKIFVDSFDTIPLCTGQLNLQLGWHIMDMFTELFILMMQLAMPVIAAELIVEVCVGVMMKTVSQIQIMSVNIQLKVIFGFLILFAICSPMSEFIREYIEKMYDACITTLPEIFA